MRYLQETDMGQRQSVRSTGGTSLRCLAIGSLFLRSDTAMLATRPVTAPTPAPVSARAVSASLSIELPGATVPGRQKAIVYSFWHWN